MEDDCYLLATPNEVLHLIIDKVSEQPEQNVHDDSRTIPKPPYNDLASVALVCHHLNSIATPALYECIRICTEETTNKKTRFSAHVSRVRLYETLRDRRHLGTYCRRLVLDLGAYMPCLGLSSAHRAINFKGHKIRPDPEASNPVRVPMHFEAEIKAIIHSLVNTRILVFSSRSNFGSSPVAGRAFLYQSIANLEKLERIHMVKEIGSSWWSSDLVQLFRALDVCLFPTNLRHVEIRGEHSTARPFPCQPASNVARIFTRPIDLCHVHLTNLVLVNSPDNPARVQATVASLKSIENFVLKYDYSFHFCHKSGEWSLSTISEILEPHRPHLKTILIGKMKKPGLGTFDVSNYPNLETLTLHNEDLEGVNTEECLQLRGPVLRKLYGAE
ncbi:hypothetical protein FGRMN_3175 [Fusarium graminum]|nr:hypothetical protein FGRMN_3175 [Fusarium graminum]